jgi:hypothetical protein
MLKQWVIITYLSLFLVSAVIHALPQEGSCLNYDFSTVMDKRGVIDTNQFVRVLRHHAPVYPTANSKKPKSNLRFGNYLLPVQVNTPHKRVQVRQVGIRTPVGWMEGYDLLCAVKPIQSEKGLDRKVFIKTPNSQEPNTNTIPAYPSYQGPCHGRCKQLSRFRLYFIFAEDKKTQRYLISDNHTLEIDPPPPLVGWIEDKDGIPWNTTLGLRPKENVEHISLTPQDQNGERAGIKLGGGKIWYTLPIHIPILDIDKNKHLYRVAAPSIGMQGLKAYKGNVLATMKQVDIFFLLDGTASMEPYIKAARQAAKNIAEKLRKIPEFKETSFRFGFRVYRDTYADKILKECRDGICEGMPLSSKTCNADNRATENNWRKFKKRLSRVKETRNEKDDYPEKLFDGLRQAIRDMVACPNRTKLLFVIADHGDKQPSLPKSIIRSLKNNFDRPVFFFIQTPNNSSKARTSSAYQAAYNRYKTQAFQIIDAVLPKAFNGKAIDRTNHFFSLNQSQLATRVVEQVKQFSRSDVINEIEQALAGGDSLKNILNRSVKAGGMPVLYWKFIEDTACDALGEQCKTVIDHRVIDFHIPIDKTKVQEEVWLTAENLDDWLSLLKPFENLVGNYTVREQRKKFVNLLRTQIQEIIGGYPDGNKVLSELLAGSRKRTLPMRKEGPLLQYTFDEIREKIEECELKRLVAWVKSIRRVLQRVYNDSTQKVNFTLEYPSKATYCPLSDKGKKIPKLKFGAVQALGKDDTYRYDHTLYGQTVYWLPIEFLP